MKIRRIFAALSAAVVMAAMSVTAFAADNATYCFDTADRLEDWQTYGSVDEAGFKIKQSAKESKNGAGSMIVSESISEPVSNGFGGAFVTADKVGLDDFRGCTVSMSVLLTKSAEGRVGNFSLYSDGVIWMEAASDELNSKTWTEIVLDIPADASNNKVGFSIPTFDVYKGDVLFIDDFTITDANGNAIANVGDFKTKPITSVNAAPAWVNIVLIAVLVVIVVVIVVVVIKLISSNANKFH
ncbi:MAG: hypothetical protein J1F11_01765 [Oscillospiraceae bacterium]|nr:hypothetical protein [Oscillospiraceae bacterium]